MLVIRPIKRISIVYLKIRLDYYTSELKKVGMTRQLLWEEYKIDYPDGYRRSQFFYHLAQHKNAARPSMVLTHTPGEKLYVDFKGQKLSYIDQTTGEVIEWLCLAFRLHSGGPKRVYIHLPG